jgi:hypothetical protein
MVDLKVMAYFKLSLSTHNWDRAIFNGFIFVTKVYLMADVEEVHHHGYTILSSFYRNIILFRVT